jgi:hypothetical protein
MSHTDWIIIITTLTISSTLGVYVVIRKIKQYSSPPVNVLQRRGDIELVDYIEPSFPQQIYQYPDLLEPIPFPWDIYGKAPSYRTGTPPLYQSMERININSCLENAINLDYILWLLLFFMLTLLIRKLFQKLFIN